MCYTQIGLWIHLNLNQNPKKVFVVMGKFILKFYIEIQRNWDCQNNLKKNKLET